MIKIDTADQNNSSASVKSHQQIVEMQWSIRRALKIAAKMQMS